MYIYIYIYLYIYIYIYYIILYYIILYYIDFRPKITLPCFLFPISHFYYKRVHQSKFTGNVTHKYSLGRVSSGK